MKGIQGREARLSVRDGQRLREALIHVSKNRLTGAKVCRNREQTVRVLREHQIASLDISGNVRAAKAINRLLGITDQKERTRPDMPARPVSVRCPGAASPHSRQKISVCRGSVSWNSSTSTCRYRAAKACRTGS